MSPTIAPPCAVRGARTPRRRATPGLLTVLLAVLTLVAAGCSSSAEQDPVTVTKVVTPTTPRSPQSPAPTRPATPPPVAGGSITSSTSTITTQNGTDPGTEDSTPDDTPTTGSTSSSSRKTSAGGAGGAPTANAPDASPDTPGPATGSACATDGTYVDEQPTGLRSDVVTGWRSIEKAANADGVIVCLNDGKRSRAQQQAQYDEYERQYGKDVADQLVLPPSKSAHVIGNAIDIQPQAAYQWLQATQGDLGFCRIYDNEPWHFEYDVKFFAQGCPARLPKPQR